jgi:hypothetical protein
MALRATACSRPLRLCALLRRPAALARSQVETATHTRFHVQLGSRQSVGTTTQHSVQSAVAEERARDGRCVAESAKCVRGGSAAARAPAA